MNFKKINFLFLSLSAILIVLLAIYLPSSDSDSGSSRSLIEAAPSKLKPKCKRGEKPICLKTGCKCPSKKFDDDYDEEEEDEEDDDDIYGASGTTNVGKPQKLTKCVPNLGCITIDKELKQKLIKIKKFIMKKIEKVCRRRPKLCSEIPPGPWRPGKKSPTKQGPKLGPKPVTKPKFDDDDEYINFTPRTG